MSFVKTAKGLIYRMVGQPDFNVTGLQVSRGPASDVPGTTGTGGGGGPWASIYTDTQCSLKLQPGEYEITANAMHYLSGLASGGNVAGRFALTWDMPGDYWHNTVIRYVDGTWCGTSLGIPQMKTHMVINWNLTITRPSGIKTRFGTWQYSGGLNSCTDQHCEGGADHGSILIARRIS